MSSNTHPGIAGRPLSRAALLVATLVVATGAPGHAFAQEQRYQMQRTDEGFVRMDMRTGEVSNCLERGDQIVCRMAADERSALMTKIDELETRIAALEEGRGAPSGLPTDDEMDRALGLMERFMRGFVGIVRDLDEPGNRS